MNRKDFLDKVVTAFKISPIVAILGPRQCGKTTLARMFANESGWEHSPEKYFDLESIIDLERLGMPEISLKSTDGLIIIDEVQRLPTLFPALRVLVDNAENKKRFLILGSASRELLHQSSETLTGRITYLELTPFNARETQDVSKLWRRGGFPKSYLAEEELISYRWRNEYIRTFVERDLPNLGVRVESKNLQRFWMMLAHYHGNIFNASEIGRSLGLSHNTIKSYLDILTDTLMIRQLQPWHENIGKRQVKSPKVYFRDSGLFHNLIGVKSHEELLFHPKLGASWEGFALEEVIRRYDAYPGECYFWATHNQAEIDLLIMKEGKRIGFEIKYTNAPKITRSMQLSLEELKLDELFILYRGDKNYSLSDKIHVKGLQHFLTQEN